MLDSTTLDIYLVDDAGQVVGRPILTFCVDGFSGLIQGYSLTWEGGMYSLRNLMMNVVSNGVCIEMIRKKKMLVFASVVVAIKSHYYFFKVECANKGGSNPALKYCRCSTGG